jgi:ABC-type lipoprotein release transport system permease subunit
MVGAVLNSLIGVLLANLIMIPVLWHLSITGIDFGSSMDTMEGMSRIFYVGFSFDIFFNGSLVGLLAGAVSAAYPALIAVHKNVVEALRYV